MAKYYVKVVGRPFGPIEAERIVQMVADGKLTRESEVSANRLDWIRLDEVTELRQALSVGLPAASPLVGGAADARVWYVTNDGVTQYGPMTQNEILRALQTGQILPTASAWRDGEQARPISEIPEFRAQNVAPVEKKEWYYSPDGRTGYGPYGVSDILAFVEQGRANFDSLVWRNGENSRPMRNEPVFMNAYNAAHSGMTANPMPIPGVNVGQGANNSREDDIYGATSLFNAEKRNKRIRLLYTMTWVGLIVAILCAVASSWFYSLADGKAGRVLVFLSTALFIVSVVASFFIASTSFILIYNFWKSIPIKFARTSPGIATGLLFVPLFNLYWCFVTLLGGARDLDSALEYYEQHGMNYGERPKFIGRASVITLAILYNVLFAVGVVAASLPIIFSVSEDVPVLLIDVVSALLKVWGYVVLCGLTFLFPLCFSGCLTGYAAATATRLLFVTSDFSDDTTLMFLWVVIFIVNMFLPFYPLFFVLCVRKMKNAALQLNYWRAGSPSVKPTGQNAARVTLDDIMNS